jgi:hypothetical protein
MVYTITLLVLSIKASGRGKSTWDASVASVDFSGDTAPGIAGPNAGEKGYAQPQSHV